MVGRDADGQLGTLKRRAAGVSVAFNVVSLAVKLVAAVLTGSVSLLSEAIHSGSDVFTSALAWLGVRAAAVPPDEEHPYGHGKIESLTGFGEAIMLIGIVGYVGFEAIHRLMVGAEVQQVDLGIGVMAASSVGSFLTARYVGGIGARARSLALLSNSQHLMADCVTSLGVMAALVITKLTGWVAADAWFALLFGAWLAYGAIRLVRAAFHELIDIRLPDEDVARIRAILDAHPDLLGYHRLRSRSSGGYRNIDLHIVVPSEWTLVRAHDLADHLEKEIAAVLAPANVVIHVDPYDATKKKAST